LKNVTLKTMVLVAAAFEVDIVFADKAITGAPLRQ